MTPTFMYPLQGALFIAQRRKLWTRVGGNLGKYILYAIPTLILLYIGGWRVQGKVLSLLLPGGFLRAVTLQALLAIEAIIALYMLMTSLMGGLSDKVFDDVLKLRGVEKVKPLSEDDLARLRKAETASKQSTGRPPRGFQQRMLNLGTRLGLWLVNSAVHRYLPLVTAPLLAIPVVGWVLWLYLNGFATGSEVHRLYFQKKGLTPSQQALVVKSRRMEYVAFGIVAFIMNLVPVLNYGFSLASTAGAALWAADLERSGEPLYKKQETKPANHN